MATFKDFRNNIKPNWCPGCGDFSVQAAIQKACAANGLEPDELAVITGIGCSGRLSGYIKSYGFHATHGRSLPVAQGVKMANDDLTVIASGGDGDGFAIGMGHTVHALKRNIDITYIVMDNQVYGLTKGQTSPSSDKASSRRRRLTVPRRRRSSRSRRPWRVERHSSPRASVRTSSS